MEWRNVNRMLTKSERPRTLDPSGSGLPSLSRRSGHNIGHRRATHSATTSGRDLGIKALIDWDSLKTEHSAQPLMQSHLLQTPEHEPTQPSTTSTRSENNRKAVLPWANSNQPCDKVLCPHELFLCDKVLCPHELFLSRWQATAAKRTSGSPDEQWRTLGGSGYAVARQLARFRSERIHKQQCRSSFGLTACPSGRACSI